MFSYLHVIRKYGPFPSCSQSVIDGTEASVMELEPIWQRNHINIPQYRICKTINLQVYISCLCLNATMFKLSFMSCILVHWSAPCCSPLHCQVVYSLDGIITYINWSLENWCFSICWINYFQMSIHRLTN